MPEKTRPALTELRDRIDAIDSRILQLLNERLDAARSIGRLKAKEGKKVLDASREAAVLARLVRANREGDLADIDLLGVYKSIIRAARRLQHKAALRARTPSLYAVFGNPVGHSLGPLMHQAAFWATGCDGAYFAVEAEAPEQITNGIRTLGIRGGSVTLPFKTAVMSCLDDVDDTARKIGAVNTILNQHGRLKGWNTDGEGVVKALQTVTGLSNKSAVVVGAGGAARAAIAGIQSAGGRVIVCNRTASHGARLAKAFGCRFELLESLPDMRVDILIHATPVGMTPRKTESLIPAEALRPGMLVMDLVYTPRKTRLLREAAAAGCDTIDGSEMFIRQGARQFELWTGMAAPVDVMRLFVHAALKEKRGVGDQSDV
jgi:shikimate dehydrogenase